MTTIPKIVIIGVGNSGTKVLGLAIQHALRQQFGLSTYHYEPLYWSGTNGEPDIKLDRAAIKEHSGYSLRPEPGAAWPWLDQFIGDLNGLAKFIRLGSRIDCLLSHQDVKVIWLVREMWSYLASMQKNFPRCDKKGGWHHSPGEYDDYARLVDLEPDLPLSATKESRLLAEAAWWAIHNKPCLDAHGRGEVHGLSFESFCQQPDRECEALSRFLGFEVTPPDIRTPKDRAVVATPHQLNWIIRHYGALNENIQTTFR